MFIKPLHSEKQMPPPLPNFGNEKNKASFHNIKLFELSKSLIIPIKEFLNSL